MGYEINRLMKQYGVGTASLAGYAGARAPITPTAPTGERPTAPTLNLSGDGKEDRAAQQAYDKQKASYDAYVKDPTAFNEAVRKYQLDQKSYGQYKDAYQNRLANTNMYNQKQFSTTGANVPAFVTLSQAQKYATGALPLPPEQMMPADKPPAATESATGEPAVEKPPAGQVFEGIGQSGLNERLRQFMANNPTPLELEEAKKRYGLNDYDFRNAMSTGTQYGTPQWNDTLQSPTYGAIPTSFIGRDPQVVGQYYRNLRDTGYTDADVRAASTAAGNTNQDMFQQAYLNAYPEYRPLVEAGYANLGRTGFGSAVNQIDQPGYNHWMSKLAMGELTPQNLNETMYNAANNWLPTTTYDQSKIPGQFDWGYYVSKYPELQGAGIDTLQEAQRHYALYGNTEGRSPYEGWTPTPAPTPPSIGNNVFSGIDFSSFLNNPNFKNILNLKNPFGALSLPTSDASYGQPGYAKGGEVKDLAEKYEVKTHYQSGGLTQLGYDSPEAEAEWLARWDAERVPVEVTPVAPMSGPAPQELPPAAPLQVEAAPSVAAAAPMSEPAPAAAAPAARDTGLQALLSKYGPGESVYAPELKAARERAGKESDAFAKLLQNALANPEDAQTSKAEMYFRLAAAFGAPTRTGKFTENLAMAGKEMGDYAKGKRESAREKLALQLKAQELRMGSAKDELATLRQLTSEEMKDKRAVATQMMKDYIESGKPQSAAGKQALDEGLTPGTPEFQKRVGQISEMKVDQQMAQINALVGNLSVAQAGLALRQQQAGKLSPAEVQMKRDTEDSLSAIGSAMRDIGEAYRLNPSTFDTSAADTAKRKTLELAGSKDPKLVATRTLENLLKSEMITSAAEKMKGVLSDSDIKLLQSVQGLDAKSVEERGNILRNAYAKLKNAQVRQQRRLEDIGSGMYGRISGE